MKSLYRIARISGIDINVHATFFILLAVFLIFMGIRGLLLVTGVFFFVTLHEFCHSIAAMHFGIKVKKITLYPIGGVASMASTSAKPFQELVIALAGPLSNIMVLIIFYFPLLMLLGREDLFYPIKMISGTSPYTNGFSIMAHIYWLNLVLALFNLIPAFPMDGGRVLRALLSYRMDFKYATKIAVRTGHIFAMFFAYIGIVYGHFVLLIIAFFVYISASNELFQLRIRDYFKEREYDRK